MELIIEKNQTDVTIKIKGDIDAPGSERLKTEFRSLDRAHVKRMVLDFQHVTHIGSAGIGKLLLFYKDIALDGGTMEIINVPASIYDLLLTMKLDSVFRIRKA